MKKGRSMRSWFCFFANCLLLFSSLSGLAESPPTAPDGGGVQQAENKLLRSQVERQAHQIEQLQKRVEQLKQQLIELGVTPAGDPGAEPAPVLEKPRRIVFVLDATASMVLRFAPIREEVLRAVREMEREQHFNVVLHGPGGVTLFQKALVPATDENQRRLSEFLKVGASGDGRLLDALMAALQLRPDVIWVASDGISDDVETALAEVQKKNVGRRTRINTLLRFSSPRPERRHFLWQLSRDSGGVCLNDDGEAADEPVVPVRLQAPAKPPARRGVFHEK